MYGAPIRTAPLVGLMATLLLLLGSSRGWAQNFDLYPDNAAQFANEFEARLRESGYQPAVEFSKQFRHDWDSYIKNSDKVRTLKLMNDIVRKDWKLIPEQMLFMKSILTVRSSQSQVQIMSDEFFPVTDSILHNYPKQDFQNYLKILSKLVRNGIISDTKRFKWGLSQQSPRLQWVRKEDSASGETKAFPRLKYSNTNITYYSNDDTVSIRGAKGYLRLFDRRFYGSEGTYDWSRVGLPPDTVYARLGDFKVDLSLKEFRIPGVKFYHKKILDEPIQGLLVEKLIHYANPEKADYPLFRSSEGYMEIDGLLKNVDYQGAFLMRGATFVGTSYQDKLNQVERPAVISIRRAVDKTVALRLTSKEFRLSAEKLESDKVSFRMLLPEGDSLYHPSMEFLYDVNNQNLLLTMGQKDKLSWRPIINSYTDYNMYFDAIRWNPNSDTIIFTAYLGKENKTFAIESKDYVKFQRYEQFQGALPYNPIGLIYRYSRDHDWQRKIPLRPFFRYYDMENKFAKERFRRALQNVEGAGFVDWDRDRNQIYARRILYNWAFSLAGKKDYDAIQLVSRKKEGNNAEMSYDTKQMYIHGVPYFLFSDSQKVEGHPAEGTVKVLKDRNLNFGGLLRAGILDFKGSGMDKFQFSYKDFKIYLDSVRSMRFKPVRHPVARQMPKKTRLIKALEKLQISNVRGAIYINRPNNKSGSDVHPEYPVFDCYTVSYKYWDDSTQYNGGVYEQDKLNFEIDPFVLDSLENFSLRGLEFRGTYNSSEIMPAFRDTLKPVRDNTYGIDEKMPKEGVPLYGGKGRFYNRVTVDGRAMWGDGEIHYLNTVAVCDSFTFHFDSVFSWHLTQDFRLKGGEYKGTNYPQLDVKRVKYRWYPKDDELVLSSKKEPMELFNGEAKFRGDIVITPEGVQGSGLLEVGNVQIESELIDFGKDNFQVQDGTFIVADPEIPTKQHFRAERVAIDYDVSEHTSEFQSIITGRRNMYFPQQKWSTSLGRGHFDRNAGQLSLQTRGTQESGSFHAVDKKMHDLTFPGDSMNYALADEHLVIDGVDSIKVADAHVYPNKGDVDIKPNGEPQTLKEAKIITDTLHRWHRFHDARVNILSGIKYKGAGKLPYKGFESKEPQEIFFSDIRTRPDTTSIATAKIPPDSKFLITNKIYYKDSVEMIANRRFLRFNGEVRIKTRSRKFKADWFSFADVVNPDSVYIKYEEDKRLAVGLIYYKTYQQFYSLFLQERLHRKKDEDVLVTQGYLTVDPRTKEFKMGARPRLSLKHYKGNVVSFDDSAGVITSRGQFDYPFHIMEGLGFQPSFTGEWRQRQASNNANLNLAMKLDFEDYPKNAFESLGKRAMRLISMNQDIDITRPQFQQDMAYFTDPEPEDSLGETMAKMAKKAENLVSIRNFDVMDEAEDAEMILSDIKFTYCDDKKDFYYSGPVGLVGVGGVSMNKIVDAKILYSQGQRLPNGRVYSDTLRMLINFDESGLDYFFLEFYGEHINTYSTINTYNMAVKSVADKQKGKKKDDDKAELRYHVVNADYALAFEQNFSQYLLSGCGETPGDTTEQDDTTNTKEATPEDEQDAQPEEPPQEDAPENNDAPGNDKAKPSGEAPENEDNTNNNDNGEEAKPDGN